MQKKKIGLLLEILWYWISWLFIAPELITYLFNSPTLLAELLAELLSVGLPVLLLATYHLKSKDDKKPLYQIVDEPLRNVRPKAIFLAIIACGALFFCVTYTINTVQMIYVMHTADLSVVTLPSEVNLPTLIGAIIVYALFPALLEELLYRGLYADAFSENHTWVLYLISSIVFAVSHSDIIAICNAFVLGLLLMTFYRRFRSLKLIVALHFIYNLLSLIFSCFYSFPFSVLNVLCDYANNSQMQFAVLVSIGIALLSLVITVFSFCSVCSKTQGRKHLLRLRKAARKIDSILP